MHHRSCTWNHSCSSSQCDSRLGLYFELECVRILENKSSAAVRATVKVEDLLAAKKLSATLQNQRSALSATPLSIGARRTNCRKVYISWYTATPRVWLNFGNGGIANGLAQKFNKEVYTYMRRSIRQVFCRKIQSESTGSRLLHVQSSSMHDYIERCAQRYNQ